MTIEKPNHIEEQKFRSVREAGYAEEDVDMYITAFTGSYNRLIDAKYESDVASEAAVAHATELEAHINAINAAAEQLQLEYNQLEASLNEANGKAAAAENQLATATNKLETLLSELKNVRKERDDAQHQVSELIDQVTALTNVAPVAPEATPVAHDSALSIDSAADQAASLLRRAEEIAKEHIAGAKFQADAVVTNAQAEAENIVGTANREIAFLEASVAELRNEKDLILSRLRDFFTYEVSHLDELIDTYQNLELPPTPEEEIQTLNAYSPEKDEAQAEAEQAYNSDHNIQYINDDHFAAPAEPATENVAPVAAYETEQAPEVSYAAPAEENYAPVEVQPDTSFEDYTPPLTEAPVSTSSVPVYTAAPETAQNFEEIVAPTYAPVAATTATGSMELPPVEGKPVKEKRSFRDVLNGRNKNQAS